MYVLPLSKTLFEPHINYTVLVRTIKTLTTVSNLHLKCHLVNLFLLFASFPLLKQIGAWSCVTENNTTGASPRWLPSGQALLQGLWLAGQSSMWVLWLSKLPNNFRLVRNAQRAWFVTSQSHELIHPTPSESHTETLSVLL